MSFGRFVVAVYRCDENLQVAIYDVVNETECSSSSFAVAGVPTVVQVLQTNSGGPLEWLLIGIGCKRGECWLVRHSLSMQYEKDLACTVESLLSHAFVPEGYNAAAGRHLPVGVGDDHTICSLAFWDEGCMLAAGFTNGYIVVHKWFQKGTFLRHAVVAPEQAQHIPRRMCFPSGERLIVARESHLDFYFISWPNDVMKAEAVASKHLGGSQNVEIVHLSCLAGRAAVALLDRTTGAVSVTGEAKADVPFEFSALHTLVAPSAQSPTSSFAFYLSQTLDGSSASVRVAGRGKAVSVEALGAGPLVLREAISAGRDALEPPLSFQLWKAAADAELLPLDFGRPLAGTSEDESAEVIMWLCLKKDCLAVLEDVLRVGGKAARAAHLRNWTHRYSEKALVEAEAVLKRFILNPAQQAVKAEIEEVFSGLGSLYRLQESLAVAVQGLEQPRMEAEAAASKTLAHAQRLEIVMALFNGGLHILDQSEFPCAEIASVCETRRKSAGKDHGYLLADYLWHAVNTGSGFPDGKFLWPPQSFSHMTDSLASSHAPVHLKHAVFLYALLDASLHGSARDMIERCFGRVCQNLVISRPFERRVRGFWMIDSNVDVMKAALELADVGVSEVGGNDAIGLICVRRLLSLGNPTAALCILRHFADPALHEDMDVHVTTYLACGMIHDALTLCRRRNHAPSFMAFLSRCDRENRLGDVVRVPLMTEEETMLFSFVGTLAAESGREMRDLLVLYLLLRSRNVEALQLWERVKSSVSARRPDQATFLNDLVTTVTSQAPDCLVRPTANSAALLTASLFLPPQYVTAGPYVPVSKEDDDVLATAPIGMDLTPDDEELVASILNATNARPLSARAAAVPSDFSGLLSTPVTSVTPKMKQRLF